MSIRFPKPTDNYKVFFEYTQAIKTLKPDSLIEIAPPCQTIEYH
jgi:hypothetical protein